MQRITKRDGRLVAFEPDKICSSLYVATELLGHPDPFLARELTDSVVHFLDAEEKLTSEEITDAVVKLAREFGHPELSRIYRQMIDSRERSPQLPVPRPRNESHESLNHLLASGPEVHVLNSFAAGETLRGYSLERVWSRDLAGAHREGLLQLTGLETPLEMAGVVVPARFQMLEAIRDARNLAGQFIAIDGIETILSRPDAPSPEVWFREVAFALDAFRLRGFVNLNIAEVPGWAANLGDGPLFDSVRQEALPEKLKEISLAILNCRSSAVTFLWHCSSADRSAKNLCLGKLLNAVEEGQAVELAFDRPRKAITLGPGLSRSGPACLTVVGINLERFVNQFSDADPEEESFARKLASLASFARSAGHVRQDYLRKMARPCAREGFLLDRSRLLVVPCGLSEAARHLAGHAASSPSAVNSAAVSLLRIVRESLASARFRTMESQIDSPPGEHRDIAIADPILSAMQQIKLAGELHQTAGGGCLTLAISEMETGDFADLVKLAGREGVGRLALGGGGR